MTRSALILVALLSLFSAAMIVLCPVSWTEIFGGLLIVWFSAIPIFIHLQNFDHLTPPFLPGVGLFYLVFFGLPVFARPWAYLQNDQVVLYWRYALPLLNWDVILLLVAGIATLFIVFYAVRMQVFAKLPRFRLSDPDPHADVLNLSYWILLVASLAFRLTPALERIPSIGQFLDPCGYLALGGFFLQWRRGRLPLWSVVVLILIVVPFDIYERVRFLFITDLLFAGIFFAFVLWRSRSMKILAAMIAAGTVVALSYSVTTMARGGGDTLIEKIQASITSVSNIRTHKWPEGYSVLPSGRVVMTSVVGEMSFDPRFSPLINRIAHVWLFQLIVEHTPSSVPYWGGHTYRPLLTSMIPRVLYPDKPQEKAGGEFGVRYGLTLAETNVTSFNIPWVVELFANFGAIGVIVGMGVFGFFLAALDRLFASNETSDLEFLIGLTIIFRLVYQESNFSVMTGSLPLQILALYFYFSVGLKVIAFCMRQLSARLTAR